jgi:simple sugar transport system substrate-binding protein
MKKLFGFLTLILIFSMLLSACAPKTTTTTEVATEEVKTGETATEVVSEPTVTEGGAPAAGTNWCSGTKIVFFPGGSAGGGFETVVYNGALAAAADTGADVEYVWSDQARLR